MFLTLGFFLLDFGRTIEASRLHDCVEAIPAHHIIIMSMFRSAFYNCFSSSLSSESIRLLVEDCRHFFFQLFRPQFNFSESVKLPLLTREFKIDFCHRILRHFRRLQGWQFLFTRIIGFFNKALIILIIPVASITVFVLASCEIAIKMAASFAIPCAVKVPKNVHYAKKSLALSKKKKNPVEMNSTIAVARLRAGVFEAVENGNK